jgi:hypothetical protein
MNNDRRKPTDHAVVMAVIVTMRWVAIINYGVLALCLGGSIFYGAKTGKWELAIITALISAVSGGAQGASGFMAGVLSQTFGKGTEPMPVVNAPETALETKPAEEEPIE